MAKKDRGVGERAVSYLDSIDLEIMETLEKYEGMAVLSLADHLKLKHQNLKKHLDKLNAVGLILVSAGEKPNQLQILHPVEFLKDMAMDSPDAEKNEKRMEAVINVQNTLKRIRGIEWDNEVSRRLALTLTGNNLKAKKPSKLAK